MAAMTTSPFRQRRFSPAEVRRIVKRAAALAEQDAATSGVEQSLSQDELEHAGISLGLPESSIRAAIATDPTSPEGSGVVKPDSQHRLLLEEELDGEVSAEQHEDLVDAIQAATGDTGSVQVVGKTLTWTPTPTTSNPPRKFTITIRARDGKTRVRIDESLRPHFLGLYIGLGLGLGFGGGVTCVTVGAALGSPFMGFGLAGLVVLASLCMAHLIYGAVARRRARQLKQIMARLREAVTDAVRSAESTAREPAREPARAPVRARIATEKVDAEAEAEAEAEVEAEIHERGASRVK
jgi:hypothetical protein